ncbi:ComEC/Rec2 family competence protein [Gangjinia marincola]|uniref:ComEC/Rec2 family competence protein n=1 Tax=Gangjinia marincola TaxID=578463 RepID=A0ABP3XX09_9FLAO
MKWLNITFIKLTFSYLLGVLFGFFVGIDLMHALIICGCVFVVFSIIYVINRKRRLNPLYFGITAYLLLILLGIISVESRSSSHSNLHYSHQHYDAKQLHHIEARIVRQLKTTSYYSNYIALIQHIDETPSTGKVLLNINDKNSSIPLESTVLFAASFSEIPQPLNPYQFNYREYMKNREVYAQLKVDSLYLVQAENSDLSVIALSDQVRTKISASLQAAGFNQKSLQLIQALLLGQKQDLDKDLYQNYANAGVVHILAVSGLHVGIILLLLQWIFKPLELLPRGKLLKLILVILCLWCFAFIAGLSPSVLRAVTMFSFLSVGLNLKRKVSTINTLCISFMLLIILQPRIIFEVGFQLSYLAVLGIILFQPVFATWYKPRFKLDKLCWNTLTVTVAAQLGVLPLSLFYFHQFPGLFFISNLVIIPMLGIILGTGVVVIILSLIGYLPQVLVNLFENILNSLNRFVGWVATQEDFIFGNIYFTPIHLALFYLIIVSLFIGLKQIKYKPLLVSLLLLQSYWIFQKAQPVDNEFIIFHNGQKTMIGSKREDSLLLRHNYEYDIRDLNTYTNYITGANIKDVILAPITSIYTPKKEVVLVVDSLGVYYPFTNNTSPIILLRNSPRVNLKRLIDSLQPKQIIADGSNYISYTKRWENTCKKEKLLFHNTRENGAFIIK